MKIIFKIFFDELYNIFKNGILHAFILKKKKFNPNENNLMAYQWNFIKQLLEIEIECNEYKRKEIFVATI